MGDGSRDLWTGAARAAAEELADNWEAAMKDGHPPSIIIRDIEDVVGLLRRWGREVSRLYFEEREVKAHGEKSNHQ